MKNKLFGQSRQNVGETTATLPLGGARDFWKEGEFE